MGLLFLCKLRREQCGGKSLLLLQDVRQTVDLAQRPSTRSLLIAMG